MSGNGPNNNQLTPLYNHTTQATNSLHDACREAARPGHLSIMNGPFLDNNNAALREAARPSHLNIPTEGHFLKLDSFDNNAALREAAPMGYLNTSGKKFK